MYARVTLMQAPTAPPKAMTMRGTSLPWMFCAHYRALQRLIIISSRPRCCVCRTCLSCLWRRCRRSLEPKMGANCTHSSIRRQAPAFVRQCWLEQPHTRHAGTVVALKAHVEISGRAWLQHRELETHGCCAGSNPREGLSDRNVHAIRKNTEGVVVLPAPTQKSAQSAGRWRELLEQAVPVKSSPPNRSLTLYIRPSSRAGTNSGPGVYRHFALQGLRKHVGGVFGRMRLPSLEVTNPFDRHYSHHD